MPWIYNPTPQTQTCPGFDGSQLSFPSRKKVYVKPEQMSAYVWNLIRGRKLANRGGDPKPKPVPKPAPAPAPVKKAEVKQDPKPKKKAKAGSANTDTSSSHHQTRDKVANDSSGKRSTKKKSKAEKKQPDVPKKEVTQGNSKTKIEADATEKPKKRRKRTFKREG